jgi:hypothetical protein
MIRTGKYKNPLDGWCKVCEIYSLKIPYFDLDLNGPVCEDCLNPVSIAEITLKSNELYTPPDELISENP